MTQTFAILLDAYRELNHRRLFWFALAISALVVAAIAMIGVDERGITILAWTIETPIINSTTVPPATFYKGIFTFFGVDYWLTWIATILALITTAGMIPDLVSSGSVDLVVSKPISRARLLVTKFVGGLLFSALQVTVFTVASFFVIGLRGGAWEPGLFLAIPLVVLVYSYLYAFCALVGVVTRSAVASLLFTLLFWFVCWALWTGFVLVNMGRIGNELSFTAAERAMQEVQRTRGEEADLSRFEAEMERTRARQPFWDSMSRYFEWTVTVLPKTSATTDLLKRELLEVASLPGASEGDEAPSDAPEVSFGGRGKGGGNPFVSSRVRDREFGPAVSRWQMAFSPTWVIGTSLGFVVVVLGLAAWIFTRRDY